MLGWWFAFTRDIRRERTFTIDDMPLVNAYTGQVKPGVTAVVLPADKSEAGTG